MEFQEHIALLYCGMDVHIVKWKMPAAYHVLAYILTLITSIPGDSCHAEFKRIAGPSMCMCRDNPSVVSGPGTDKWPRIWLISAQVPLVPCITSGTIYFYEQVFKLCCTMLTGFQYLQVTTQQCDVLGLKQCKWCISRVHIHIQCIVPVPYTGERVGMHPN